MACGADNLQTKLAIKNGTGTVDFTSGATGIEYTSHSLKATGSLLRSAGIRGTRGVSVNQSRKGPYTLAGDVNFDVSPQSLLVWGARALGTDTSGVLTPAESVPVFSLMADLQVGVVRFEDCKVTKLTIRGSSGGLITGTASIVGRGYTNSGLSYPSLTLGSDATYAPLAFSDLVFESEETEFESNSFESAVDNAIVTRTSNSLYPGCAREGVRTVTLNANLPSTSGAQTAFDEPDLSGISAVLTLTSTLAAIGATFEMPVCQKARDTPTVNGPGEQAWDISLQAVTSEDESDEITITVDTTEE